MINKAKKINTNIREQPQITVPIKKISNTYVYATICFLFAFILYSNTFNHSYVLDDNSSITDNGIVKKGIQSIPTILKTTYWYGANDKHDIIYRPLSLIMFAIEWQIASDNPHLSHFINVLFYALSCLLLFIVLRKYMSKIHTLIPFFITMLYTAHPIHTEVVANIKSRDEIMSFFFLMFTLLFLHIWFTKGKWWSLLVSLLMYFLSFLSKEGVITMLFIFPIIGWYFTEAKPKTIIIGSLLLIIPAIAYITIRYQILSNYNVSHTINIIENSLTGAPNPLSHLATAIMLLGKYLLLSIVPYQLVCDYSYNQIPIVGLSNPLFIISFLIYIALCIYVILNFRKRSPLIFGLLFFLITISMYSNILFHIGTPFAERLMFLPSLGVCITFVFFIFQLFKLNINNRIISEIKILRSKPIFTIIIILILFAFSIKTVVRAAEWKDKTTLFGNDIKRSPNSAHLCFWWGETLFDKAEKENDKIKKDAILLQSASQFEKGLSIYPSYVGCYDQLGLAWYQLKDNRKALFYYNNALKLNPTDAKTLINIGLIYYEQGNFHQAMDAYNKSISINNNYSDAYYNRGLLKNKIQDYKGAIEDYNMAININPKDPDAYYNRGLLKNKFQDYLGAIADFDIAININPDYDMFYYFRGLAKHNLKDYTEAIADYNMAVKINPNCYNAYLNIGCILGGEELMKYDEAIDEFKKCIQFDPQNINAHKNIGMCYQKLNKPVEANLWFEKARILEQKLNK